MLEESEDTPVLQSFYGVVDGTILNFIGRASLRAEKNLTHSPYSARHKHALFELGDLETGSPGAGSKLGKISRKKLKEALSSLLMRLASSPVVHLRR
jgi:hypothetical protein